MSITSREDANKYYQVVNKLVDEYMDKWKIRPTNLKRYLKIGSDKFEKFIERNGLKDINGIKQVINDVINDRVHMEKDGVLTFERYKFFEIDEYKSIQSKIKRYTEPKELELKQIINDDFIYIENFENNQNVSIFNSYTKRNRRYNFNRKSLFRLFFNEYSYF